MPGRGELIEYRLQVVNIEVGRILTDAFNLRIESDYEDFFYLDYEEAKESVEDAEKFIKSITEIIV
jgi:uncharacterized protein (UPF0332 family)